MPIFNIINNNISYLQATPAHCAAIYALVQECIRTVYPKYYSEEVVDFFCGLHNMDSIRRDIDRHSVGLLFDGELPVGTGTYQENHITRVYVLPRQQKKGYGSFMMERLEEQVAAEYETAYLDASLPAVGFYEKLGYRTVKQEECKIDSETVLVYRVMEKQLARKSSL